MGEKMEIKIAKLAYASLKEGIESTAETEGAKSHLIGQKLELEE